MASSRPTRAGLSTTSHPALAILKQRFSGSFCEIHSPDFLSEHRPGDMWRCSTCFADIVCHNTGHPRLANNGLERDGVTLRQTVACSQKACGQRQSKALKLTFSSPQAIRAFILHYNDPADGDDDSEVSDDGLEDLLGWACKDSESTWLSQCFLANRGKWGGRASKLLNRTWRVIYDWHDSTQPLVRPPISAQRVPRLGKALLEGAHSISSSSKGKHRLKLAQSWGFQGCRWGPQSETDKQRNNRVSSWEWHLPDDAFPGPLPLCQAAVRAAPPEAPRARRRDMTGEADDEEEECQLRHILVWKRSVDAPESVLGEVSLREGATVSDLRLAIQQDLCQGNHLIMERQDGSPLRLRFESDETLPLHRMLPFDQDSVFIREAPPLPKSLLPRAPPKRASDFTTGEMWGREEQAQSKKRVRKRQALAGEPRASKKMNKGEAGMPGVAGWKLGTGPESGIGGSKVSYERSKLAKKLQKRLHDTTTESVGSAANPSAELQQLLPPPNAAGDALLGLPAFADMAHVASDATVDKAQARVFLIADTPAANSAVIVEASVGGDMCGGAGEGEESGEAVA